MASLANIRDSHSVRERSLGFLWTVAEYYSLTILRLLSVKSFVILRAVPLIQAKKFPFPNPTIILTNNFILISGVDTDIMCHKFQNRTLLIVTQFGKIGNIFTVTNSQFNGGILSNRQRVHEITPRFGGVSDENEGAVRYLMNFFKIDNLVISLALKKINKDILLELRNHLGTIDGLIRK